MFKVKILPMVLGCLFILPNMAISETIDEPRITAAVVEAGKCLQKQQFAKVIELL